MVHLVHMRVPRLPSVQCCDAVRTSIFDRIGLAAIVEEGRTEWQLFATICQICFGSITNSRDGNCCLLLLVPSISLVLITYKQNSLRVNTG